MSFRRSLAERTMPTGKSTAVSMIAWAWFFSATAVLVAAFFVAFAVLAADFFASVVERLACVFDLLVPLLLVLSAMKTYPSWFKSDGSGGAESSEHTFLRTDVLKHRYAFGYTEGVPGLRGRGPASQGRREAKRGERTQVRDPSRATEDTARRPHAPSGVLGGADGSQRRLVAGGRHRVTGTEVERGVGEVAVAESH